MCDGRGRAEPWMKEGKYALQWTRLSCHRCVANQVRLQLFILAYKAQTQQACHQGQ
jgi:Transposase DDE domain group 1